VTLIEVIIVDSIDRTLKTAAFQPHLALSAEPILHGKMANANGKEKADPPVIDPFHGSSHTTVMAIQDLARANMPSSESSNFMSDYYEALPQASEEAKMNFIKKDKTTLQETIDRIVVKVELGELKDTAGKWTSYITDLKSQMDSLKA
jgi:hypothetical protein